ncbi:MAG TPA: SIS domain-containing protein, partial [Actinomycetota bacterium]|nr:SIS domain-containing protein [Actinomycetota bacterium]
MTGADRIVEYLRRTMDTVSATAEYCSEEIARAAAAIAESVRGGGKVLICGNGGSAADSQHLAAELVSTLTVDRRRPAIPALALTTDTSILTAVSNDFGFEGVFARQVEALGTAGDVLIGISTSGNSEDVVLATEQAARQGIRTVALTGESGGKLGQLADISIRVPSSETSHVQEAHLAVEQL